MNTTYKNELSLGICLSGGGARGAAHIGVFGALEEHGISPTFVSGANAGSIVGALYAYGHSPKMIWNIINETKILSLLKLRFGMGLMDLSSLKDILKEIFAENSFKGFLKEYFLCVSNINTGQWEIMKDGDLFSAIEASCAIPLVFKPVKIGDSYYCDGGLLNNLPVEPLRYRCDKVIGVNVVPVFPKEDVNGFIDMAERSMDLVINSNTILRKQMCDVVIEIKGIEEYPMYDVNKMSEMYELGYQYTLSQISLIKTLIA